MLLLITNKAMENKINKQICMYMIQFNTGKRQENNGYDSKVEGTPLLGRGIWVLSCDNLRLGEP